MAKVALSMGEAAKFCRFEGVKVSKWQNGKSREAETLVGKYVSERNSGDSLESNFIVCICPPWPQRT